jgi:hypothetical protein
MMTTVAGAVITNRIVASPTTGLIIAGITVIIKTTAVMTSGAAMESIKNHTL